MTPVFKSLKTKGGVVLIKNARYPPDYSMVWEITCIMRHNEEGENCAAGNIIYEIYDK